MAGVQEDFLYEDDFDAVMAIIDADLFENDEDFSAEVKDTIKNIPCAKDSPQYPCNFCEKVCLSKGGFTRHLNTKYKEEVSIQDTPSCSKPKEAEEILHPLYFKKYLKKSASKLAADECYPPEMNEFQNFKIETLEDVADAYLLIKPILAEFNGNAAKYYPRFYKVFSETNPFQNLSHNCCLLLGFEVANHVLSRLTGAIYNENVLTIDDISPKFTEREKSIIAYLSGYVFGTLYRRIRFSKSSQDSTDL